MLKHTQKKSETLALCLLEQESPIPRKGETLLVSVIQNLKWVSAAVLHEKAAPHSLTCNLIISLQSNSCWIYRAKPNHLLFDQLLAQGQRHRGERSCEEGAYF